MTQWLRAARLHQWTKNLAILAPAALGWKQVTPSGLLALLMSIALFCVLSSLTYIVNDIADVGADRQHPNKRARPFASGELSLRQGLLVAGLGIPLTLVLGCLISIPVGLCLAAYCALTFSYSGGLKRAPIIDCMAIGGLFTLRLVTGVVAAHLEWSAWFLTFGSVFFCSLALAKRHTELVGRGGASGAVPGRGYRYEDAPLTLAFGAATSVASIVILILYLMEEAFPRGVYGQPGFLWAAPPIVFAWMSRIWVISNRGGMNEDPVVFALRDWVSLGLGALLAIAFLCALA